jgi:ferredoxin-NADP reductase
MPKYQTKLIAREEIATGTMAFHFAKPKDYSFVAGQNNDITLINPPETDAEGNTRAFSVASAPHEDTIMIATRMRDTAFKRVLKNAPLGIEVTIDGPMGSLTLHKNISKPAVFLSGGIGVTPFRSIALDAAHNKLPHKIFLFYSNRRPEDAAFLNELQELTRDNPNYTFIGTMTDMDHSQQPWNGETGYITKEMLSKYLPDLALPIYYLAGPPTMVAAMKEMLSKAGADEDNIRIEEFSGY